MKTYLYLAFKWAIRTGFRCYYKEIRMCHMDRIPLDCPVMLLPNHQNALMDPLLYAAFAKGKPYFLTRSDVFQNKWLRWVFEGLRMMPVYRLRDGRETLGKNTEVFERCAVLFSQDEQLLLFPEANHSLRRQVRPLSKGFTRILAQTFEHYPDLDVLIAPVGMNYQAAARFPDRVAMYFGTPFSSRQYWSDQDRELNFGPLRERAFNGITQVTTHIPPTLDYEQWERALEEGQVDFTDPISINTRILNTDFPKKAKVPTKNILGRLWDLAFRMVNAPVWLPWRWIAKNKVPEPEFTSTFRFLYCLVAFPLYYVSLGILLSLLLSISKALIVLLLLFLHNLLYVKLR